MIKAIETKYNGYHFRSRLEARWAVFFDSLNEPWEYEVEGFELESGRYLPDFWLPRLGCWLEIKGQSPTKHEQQLCYELAWATEKPVAIAWGLPVAPSVKGTWHDPEMYAAERLAVFCTDFTDSSGGDHLWDESFWAFDKDGKLCICSNNNFPSREFMTPGYRSFDSMKLLRDIQGPITEAFVNKAKSARFEFCS
jgi:hypothetical protein